MNIPNQFQQIGIFLAHNRFVSILEKMAVTSVPPVEINGIASQQLAHAG